MTEVLSAETTVQPLVAHAPAVVSYHRHCGTGMTVGHEKVMAVPSDPGPHANVRLPNTGPQSVESRYKNALLTGATVGIIPALRNCVEPDTPLGALSGTVDPSIDADTMDVPTTVANERADTLTRRTSAVPVAMPPRIYDAVMPRSALAEEVGHVTFNSDVANFPCPMLMPVGDEMDKSSRGMVTMTGMVVVIGTAPRPTVRTETTRESSGRAGSRSYATRGRGTSAESSASVEALGLRHPRAVSTAPCSELNTPVKNARRRAGGAEAFPAARAISALPTAMRGV